MLVTLKWAKVNKEFYQNKGYVFTKFGDEFQVSVEDLSPKSTAKIERTCGLCGITKMVRAVDWLNRDEYFCRKCQPTVNYRIELEDVKAEFESRGYVPTFTEYSDRKYTYICPQHPGKEQSICLGDLKNGHGCKYCGIESRAAKNRLPIEQIKALFTDNGYTPLFDELDRVTDSVPFICPVHGIQYVTVNTFKRTLACPTCNIQANKPRMLSFETVVERFTSKDLTPLFTEYTGSHIPLPYICNKHPHKGIQTITASSILKSSCYYCSLDTKSTGRYYNEARSITKYLRKQTAFWKTKVKHQYGGECVISGTRDNIHIHHILAFSKIVEWAHKSLGIKLRPKKEDYTNKELHALDDLVEYYHHKFKALGVPLNRNVHMQLHREYGKDCGMLEWLEFEAKHKNIEGIL